MIGIVGLIIDIEFHYLVRKVILNPSCLGGAIPCPEYRLNLYHEKVCEKVLYYLPIFKPGDESV